MRGDDRAVTIASDLFKALIEFHQIAIFGQFAFREDSDNRAGFHRFASVL